MKKILIGSFLLILSLALIDARESDLRPYRLINSDQLNIKLVNEEYVTITDYFTDGGVKIILVADTLIIDEHTNTLTAKGGVVITREEGTLKTEHLIWNQNNDEVSSPVEAVIIRGDNILKGFELTTDTEFSVINMKRVTAEGHLHEEDIDW